MFSGARTDYEIRADGTALRVMRKGHPEDTSLLHNVESLQFDDAVLNSADLRIVDGNIAPLAKDLSLSTPEDQALTLTLAELTASVVDLDGNGAVTLVAAEAATGGTATLTPEGGVVFTPDPDFNGDAAFTLTFADADGAQTTAEVTVDVTPVADAPETQDDQLDLEQGVTIDLGAGTASGGDAEGDILTNIETVKGSDQNDSLTGDAGDNFLDGREGDDILKAGAGNDALRGAEGIDTVVLSGTLADYEISEYPDGPAYVIRDLCDGSPDGEDIIKDLCIISALRASDFLVG